MGARSLTTSDKFVVALPDEFEAVILYVALAVTAVGTPEMTPVMLSKESPAGSTGLTVYAETEPVTVGFNGAISAPTVMAEATV